MEMKMDYYSLLLAIMVFCVVMSAYFSATETAFSALNRIRVKNMAEKGDKRAKLVMGLAENYDSLISTILIGNNIVNIACASIATLMFVRFLGNETGATVSTIVTTVVILIFGEVSPKSIAKESPEKFALFSAPLLSFFIFVFTPLNYLFKQWKKLLSKMFKPREEHSITEEELITLVEEAEQEGGLNQQEGALIKSAIEFSELEAMDILTPRVNVVAISIDAPHKEIADIFLKTGFSRIPVYADNFDNIVGILYQKDFYNYIFNSTKEISSVMRPPIFISGNNNAGELLKELQLQKSHIAVVVDEFGGNIGIVTLEDIIEELVGEIWDEHDTIIEEIEELSDGEYIVLGNTNLSKLFAYLGFKDAPEALTVGGWVIDELGGLPQEGDQFTYQRMKISVLRRIKNKVEKVHILITGNDPVTYRE